MTSLHLVLGAAAGGALGIAVTALRWALVRRFTDRPSIPPSAEVLDAERMHRDQLPLTDRRTP
jgi:hypothetical protein